MSAQLTWKALDEAAETRTAANRPAFLPQTLTFRGKPSFGRAICLRSDTIPWNRCRKRRFRMKSLTVPASEELRFYHGTSGNQLHI